MKSHFHMKRWAPRLALRKRFKVIRKWPIIIVLRFNVEKRGILIIRVIEIKKKINKLNKYNSIQYSIIQISS